MIRHVVLIDADGNITNLSSAYRAEYQDVYDISGNEPILLAQEYLYNKTIIATYSREFN